MIELVDALLRVKFRRKSSSIINDFRFIGNTRPYELLKQDHSMCECGVLVG